MVAPAECWGSVARKKPKTPARRASKAQDRVVTRGEVGFEIVFILESGMFS
jgi:hypothetical protein